MGNETLCRHLQEIKVVAKGAGVCAEVQEVKNICRT